MKTMHQKHGFSLIELLTVIAIIAILAAIIFPVMSAVKARANTTKCITQLMQIQQGLKMYQLDNRRFPDTIAGYVQYDGSSNVIPLEQTKMTNSLFPEYTKSYRVFNCPLSNTKSTSAVVVANVNGVDRDFYAYCSYDAYTSQPVEPGNRVAGEIRYNTAWAAQPADVGIFNPTPGETESDPLKNYDFKRQLKFRNPSDDTVVTWCSYHRKGNDSGSTVPVLFLDGHVDMIPAVEMEGNGGSNLGCRWRHHGKK